MHYARSSRKANNRSHGGKGKFTRPYHQRCAVRVTYLKNKIRGQWKAHGRYLGRESASFEKDANAVGFDRERVGINIARQLLDWQTAGDERIWKLIISPEFGDRVDLSRLTRDLIERMENDLGTDLEWAAVEHHNTEHPHVHVVVRGVRSSGESLRLNRDYVQQGIRNIAADLCTRQLGYRTELDSFESERREITEKRFTSLDRRLLRGTQAPSSDLEPQYFAVIRNPLQFGPDETTRIHGQQEVARLAVLCKMGLAKPIGPSEWRVRRDLEPILRAMQKAIDRQRTLAAHGAVMSDRRLPIGVLDLNQVASVDGRVLVHGQDEQTGRNYLMVEGTDAKIHFIHYTPEIEKARSRGELGTNSFMRLRKRFGDSIEINDLGDAENVLSNRLQLGKAARELVERGIMPTEDGWGGWLGRYQKALRDTALETAEQHKRDQIRIRDRHRDRSIGR